MPGWTSMRATEEELFAPRLHPDPKVIRWLAIVNGAVPFTLLVFDAWRGHLGANGVNFAIHTTGLLALLFFVLSLVVTPLKRMTRWNEVVAARRALGLYGFFYLVAHFTIFFVWDRERSVSGTIHEILERQYLQIGTVALLLFIPLAVSSTDGMITRLGPRHIVSVHVVQSRLLCERIEHLLGLLTRHPTQVK